MKKLLAGTVFVMFAMSVLTLPVFAEGTKEAVPSGVTDVGNKFCPVMGGPVSGKDFVVYQGKRYGLCCPGCEKTFLSDPANYIAQTERKESVPAAAKGTVAPIDPKSEEMERGMEQGDL